MVLETPRTPRTQKAEAIVNDQLYFFGFEREGADPAKYVCFSNMHPCIFSDENGNEYTCSEQYIMVMKAKLFGDEDAAKQILDFKPPEHKPREYQKMGRQIKGFDESVWQAEREKLMHQALMLKFSAAGNEALRTRLLETEGLTIVEASVRDSVWGIGISVSEAVDGCEWRGQNLLGQALVAVRDQLLAASSAGVNPIELEAYSFRSTLGWPGCYNRPRR